LAASCASGSPDQEDGVNKSELIAAIAERTNQSKRAVEDVLDEFIDTVGTTVKKGEKVILTGFGTFERRSRSARQALNPQTGERIRVKAKKVPAFKPGSLFKETVAPSGAKKSAGKKSSAKKSSAKKSAAKKSTAKKSGAKKSGAKKSGAKKSGAKKSAAKKSAKKS
jgi:DNA-binding protein HU-beta